MLDRHLDLWQFLMVVVAAADFPSLQRQFVFEEVAQSIQPQSDGNNETDLLWAIFDSDSSPANSLTYIFPIFSSGFGILSYLLPDPPT